VMVKKSTAEEKSAEIEKGLAEVQPLLLAA
jgi:hypothetical protein